MYVLRSFVVVCGQPWVDILVYGGHGGMVGCTGDVGSKAPPLRDRGKWT